MSEMDWNMKYLTGFLRVFFNTKQKPSLYMYIIKCYKYVSSLAMLSFFIEKEKKEGNEGYFTGYLLFCLKIALLVACTHYKQKSQDDHVDV